MSVREEMRAALLELEQAREGLAAIMSNDHPLAVEYRTEVLAAAEAARKKGKPHPKTVTDAWKILGAEAAGAIKDRYQPRADQLYEAAQAAVKTAEQRRDAAALACEPEPGEDWLFLESTSPSFYRSQGYGAMKYAQGAAEMRADLARQYGLEVRVTWVEEEIKGSIYEPGTYKLGRYEVEVKAKEPLDLEIIRHGKAPTLREQVRLCWKRGCQPRCFSPWLPVGYEESVGLDYFGGETKKES